jgi:hypothetical protein
LKLWEKLKKKLKKEKPQYTYTQVTPEQLIQTLEPTISTMPTDIDQNISPEQKLQSQEPKHWLNRLRRSPSNKGLNMKAMILYHENENIIRLERTEIKDGNITIGDKTFDVDKFKPKLLKKGIGYMPLYMLKWDTINPPTDFNPTFSPDKDGITPEIYHKTMKMKILGNMLKVEKKRNVWMLVIIGAAFGVFIFYYLYAMGLLKGII